MFEEYHCGNQLQRKHRRYFELKNIKTYVAVGARVFSVATRIPFERVVISISKL